MNAKTRQKSLYVLLTAAVIWGGYNFMPAREQNVPVESLSTAAPRSLPDTSFCRPDSIQLQELELLAWSSDPFRTRVVRKAAPVKNEITWIVSGIIFNATNPMAVINRRTVRVGDSVDDAVVIAIERKSVTLEKNGRKFTLGVQKG